ncbi:cold-shock protein [Henriciella marina]|uniref:cold-shock protein n=1 Tax=Henriciella marina TaxID=453851 RepID=UPI000475856E|nr:cold shock domain-containing protein [Henriciella marina]
MSALRSGLDKAEPSPSVRVIGAIKWFDPAKGYGFIIPDSVTSTELSGDIMIHISALRAYGEVDADEGARIVCDAVECERGWQVENIIEMDRPREVIAKEKGDAPEPEGVVVKWFSAERGFGFVNRLSSEEDVFVHISVLRRSGVSVIEPGQMLTATISNGTRGEYVSAVIGD